MASVKMKDMTAEQLVDCARAASARGDNHTAGYLWDEAANRTIDPQRCQDWRGNALMCRKASQIHE